MLILNNGQLPPAPPDFIASGVTIVAQRRCETGAQLLDGQPLDLLPMEEMCTEIRTECVFFLAVTVP